MDPITALTLIVLGATFIYHLYDTPPKPKPATDITLPRTDDGAPVPLIYGRCLVKAPVLAFADNPVAFFDEDNNRYYYTLDLFYNIGIPFTDGLCNINGMWAGEYKLHRATPFGLNIKAWESLDGDGDSYFTGGNHEYAKIAGDEGTLVAGAPVTIGTVEFLNGNTSQTLMELISFDPKTVVGSFMEDDGVDESTIPGYRGYACAFLFDVTSAADGHWVVGTSPQVPAYAFEMSAYPSVSAALDGQQIGYEANPADVIYDLLCGTFGKLGMDPTLVDSVSFAAAAVTLADEEHGFSMCFDERMKAGEMIEVVLKQINAVLIEDPDDGKLKLTLIRADYTIYNTLLITPDNCFKLNLPAAGGWTSKVNKLKIIFTDRANRYADGAGVALNQANASNQDGVDDVVIHMPGICSQALADVVAARELSARSRPLFKCTAIVNREFLRTVPGHVVQVYWPKFGVGVTTTMFMRVAGVSRGTLEEGKIELDLVQDFLDVPGIPAFADVAEA